MKSFVSWAAAAAIAGGFAAVASGLRDEGPMPDLDGAVAWLNSAPLSSKALRGKVVLVNFWTYSCINSLRELPYMKAWAAKYKDAGLVVIGVHAPEFGFEKEPHNVKKAVSELNVAYPVPIDSNHSIWRAFRNEYWPADYFIDAKGRIRYRHFGEGEYEKSERVIQMLLKENGAAAIDESLVRITADGAEAPPSGDVRSPETYAGYARAENFASRADGARLSKDLQPAREPYIESVGARRIVEGRSRERRARLGAWKDRVPVPQPRPPYGPRPGQERNARPLQNKAEWRRARRRSRVRFRAPMDRARFRSHGCISLCGRRGRSET